jgi:nitroreductase
VRRFEPDDVPPELVRELADLARQAPSSMNGQPWRFVVVRRPDLKQELARLKNDFCPPDKKSYTADFVALAPVIVVICVERGRSHDREIENGVLAAASFMLAATSRGLATVYLSAYRQDAPQLQEEVRRLLQLPEDVMPVTLLPLGRAAETPAPKTLRPLEEMVFDGEL